MDARDTIEQLNEDKTALTKEIERSHVEKTQLLSEVRRLTD
jgi:hypothetical protein